MFRPATFAFWAGFGGYEPLSPALRLGSPGCAILPDICFPGSLQLVVARQLGIQFSKIAPPFFEEAPKNWFSSAERLSPPRSKPESRNQPSLEVETFKKRLVSGF